MQKINVARVCAAVFAFAATSVSATPISYAAGATDLDGKIVITYDTAETSKIKTLVATPADGETLEVSGDAMTFAADATMSFADSSSRSWTGSLYVKNFRDKAIRIGTSAAALTAAQQNRIRKVGGGRLYLDDDGYLRQPGIAIIIR